MNIPKISIIMPVYNSEKYLDSAIKSILSQTFTDFEFIIIDDGSTDSSSKIISRYAQSDSRIRALSQDNRGIVYSLNLAIKLSVGEYIARMDSDDISLPDRLDKQFQYLENNASVGVVGTQAHVINHSNEIIGSIKKPKKMKDIQKFLKYGCPLLHPTYLARRSVYLDLNGYRNIVAAEDLDFLIRTISKNIILANLPEHLLLYRVNFSGISYRNARFQMRNTRILLKQYRRGCKSLTESLDNTAVFSEIKYSYLFDFCLKRRNRIQKNRAKYGNISFSFMMILYSLGHYEMTFSSIRVLINKYLNNF